MQWAGYHDPKLERAEGVRVQVVSPQLERLEQCGRRLVEARGSSIGYFPLVEARQRGEAGL